MLHLIRETYVAMSKVNVSVRKVDHFWFENLDYLKESAAKTNCRCRFLLLMWLFNYYAQIFNLLEKYHLLTNENKYCSDLGFRGDFSIYWFQCFWLQFHMRKRPTFRGLCHFHSTFGPIQLWRCLRITRRRLYLALSSISNTRGLWWLCRIFTIFVAIFL